jgi:hypothetical protein
MKVQEFDDLTVAEIDYATAKEVIVQNHYSHKWNTAFGTDCFGIYAKGQMLGVAVYGHAMNPKAWKSITSISDNQCIELNRFWIDDQLGKNTETWFLSKTFSLLKQKNFRLIQSFADGRLGVGTIYQAANFGYYGLHKTLFHQTEKNEMLHDAKFTDTARGSGMVWRNILHAEKNLSTFEVNTYRYLYAIDRASKRSIKLKELPYPKERVGLKKITGYVPPARQIARAAVLSEVFGKGIEAAKLKTYLCSITPNANDLMTEAYENPIIAKQMMANMQKDISNYIEPLF